VDCGRVVLFESRVDEENMGFGQCMLLAPFKSRDLGERTSTRVA
jgi:hypothetical protein